MTPNGMGLGSCLAVVTRLAAAALTAFEIARNGFLVGSGIV